MSHSVIWTSPRPSANGHFWRIWSSGHLEVLPSGWQPGDPHPRTGSRWPTDTPEARERSRESNSRDDDKFGEARGRDRDAEMSGSASPESANGSALMIALRLAISGAAVTFMARLVEVEVDPPDAPIGNEGWA